jgi:hypothetical protein
MRKMKPNVLLVSLHRAWFLSLMSNLKSKTERSSYTVLGNLEGVDLSIGPNHHQIQDNLHVL